MRNALSGTNLLPALLAAALLVLLVFLFGLPLWLAVPAALVAFVGIALLLPGRDAAGDAGSLPAELRRGSAETAAIRQLSSQIAEAAVAGRVRAIADLADRTLTVLGADRRDPRTAALFVDRYLEPTRTLLTQYVRLSGRGVAAAEGTLDKIEANDLPLIETRLRELYEGLHRGDVIDLEVASEMLEFELSGIEPPKPRAVEAKEA